MTAEVEVPKGGANGVIIAQGGAFAGWSLYLHEGKPKYCHNLAGLMRFYVEGTRKVPAGKHQVRMEFAYDGGGLAKGGTSTLFIDGKKVGEGRINATVPMIYSGDETCDLGVDTGTPVSEDYTSESSNFTGRVKWVELQLATTAMITSSPLKTSCGWRQPSSSAPRTAPDNITRGPGGNCG